MAWYDVFARFYDASLEPHYREQRALAAAALDLTPDSVVLDLPCGTGQSLPHLLERGAGRILGVKWGVLVGVLDVLKGFVPCWFLAGFMGVTASAVCGLAVVLGHMFSPLLKWRGGKGVATTLGVLLAVAPWIALIAVVVFGLGLAILKRVGEASVVTCLVLVVVGVLQGLGVVHLARWGATGVGWVVVILALLVLARHKRNILIGLERRRRAVHRP